MKAVATSISDPDPLKDAPSSSSVSGSTGGCISVDTFQKLNRIGEGTYGLVYRAVDKRSNQIVALKRIIMHNEMQDGFPTTTLREIQALKCINGHPNCVLLHEVACGSRRDAVFLVFEYCEHDLAVLTDTNYNPFTESEIKTLIIQLLSAVSYLHANHIIHRDIKLSNLLYNHRGQLKLADFGLARTYSVPNKTMTQKVVSLWYRAPELLLGSNMYTPAVDDWAVGCVLGELLRRKPLLAGRDEVQQISLIFNLIGAPTSRIWPDIDYLPFVTEMKIDLLKEQAKFPFSNLPSMFLDISNEGVDLLMRLLAYDPNKRLRASEALQHAYLHESPFPKQEALMPTFRTRHDDDNISGTSNVLGNKDKGGLGLGYRNISGNSNSNNSNIGQWKRQRR